MFFTSLSLAIGHSHTTASCTGLFSGSQHGVASWQNNRHRSCPGVPAPHFQFEPLLSATPQQGTRCSPALPSSGESRQRVAGGVGGLGPIPLRWKLLNLHPPSPSFPAPWPRQVPALQPSSEPAPSSSLQDLQGTSACWMDLGHKQQASYSAGLEMGPNTTTFFQCYPSNIHNTAEKPSRNAAIPEPWQEVL